jgi:hypothetical protein
MVFAGPKGVVRWRNRHGGFQFYPEVLPDRHHQPLPVTTGCHASTSAAEDERSRCSWTLLLSRAAGDNRGTAARTPLRRRGTRRWRQHRRNRRELALPLGLQRRVPDPDPPIAKSGTARPPGSAHGREWLMHGGKPRRVESSDLYLGGAGEYSTNGTWQFGQ